ncbi:MAG: prepilin-type N-terminal cleavage/methylation domain-containing protein [Sedimentisphaerales bacterium]|nr:prepilin-type N-terminal cleavage/methylation domain-containing protein [Sedimentisphaerales bacterium]
MTKYSNKYKYSRRRRRSAFTLVELLMALAITAMLIAATSVAFDAALRSYEANQEQGLASLAARNVLQQLCREVRSAHNDPDTPIIVSTDGTECSFVDVADETIVYSYDADLRQLLVNINGGDNWYVFLDGVDPIAPGEPIFATFPPTAEGFELGIVGRIAIRFTIEREQARYPVYASVVPRNVALQN